MIDTIRKNRTEYKVFEEAVDVAYDLKHLYAYDDKVRANKEKDKEDEQIL